MTEPESQRRFHGPACWLASALAGLVAGALLALSFPAQYDGASPEIPLWLVAPFGLLLASIALVPFINPRFWRRHYPDFAFALGGLVVGYYLTALRAGAYGPRHVLHALIDYYSFIALIGGLYVVSGGILVDLRGRATPVANTALLVIGALAANVVGTTGASMLLIRPFMRINRGRLRPLHIVFFIFIISNCGGSLTAVGDPPLYLGYLKGVPFLWPLVHIWKGWALTIGLLAVAFFAYDRVACGGNKATYAPLATASEAQHPAEAGLEAPRGIRIRGAAGLICLPLMVGGAFIDPLLRHITGVKEIPVGATFQVLVAAAAYRLTPRDILASNDFTFAPVKEVGLLFLGIFACMMPALAYLAANGHDLGLRSPTSLYFGSGALSAVLDNAPTYLNFLQIAFGPHPIDADTLADSLQTDAGDLVLGAISTGTVFFGAMTYIGNGPNFMVKSIAESAGVRMPSFFGYVGYALAILLPVLIVHWAVLIR